MESTGGSVNPEDFQKSEFISRYEFTAKVLDTPIYYQVSKFGTTLFIWIGGTDGSMKDLVFAASTPYDAGKSPSSTKLLGNVGDNLSTSLATKLTQKLKKPVFVSYNLNITMDIGFGVQEVIGRLMEEIKLFPDKF